MTVSVVILAFLLKAVFRAEAQLEEDDHTNIAVARSFGIALRQVYWNLPVLKRLDHDINSFWS